MVRTALLTISDKGAAMAREDATAQAIRQVLSSGPFVEVDYQLVPDEQAMIRAKLRLWSDSPNIDLVLTSGGTGLGIRDRTPEATAEVIERQVPGIAEAIRARGAVGNPHAYLSRALAGVRRTTLIVNLPGSPAGAAEALKAVAGILPHAVDVIRGEGRDAPSAWHE